MVDVTPAVPPTPDWFTAPGGDPLPSVATFLVMWLRQLAVHHANLMLSARSTTPDRPDLLLRGARNRISYSDLLTCNNFQISWPPSPTTQRLCPVCSAINRT